MIKAFSRLLLRAGSMTEAVLRRAWQSAVRLGLSKPAAAKMAAGKLTTLRRREAEVERLDRLRNPRNYIGR